MSSSLYRVSVDAVDGPNVEFFVSIIHPDISGVPSSKTFAFRLVADPIFDWQLGGEPGVADSPLAGEVDMNDYLNEQWVDENAGGFIESVEEDDGILRVTTTHAGWTEQLESDMVWETTSYDSGPAEPWEGETRYPGDRVWVRAESADQGFQPLEKTGLNGHYFEDYGLEEGMPVPTEGSSYYVPDDKVEGDPVPASELESLLGQPVIVETDSDTHVGTLVRQHDPEGYAVYYESDGSLGLYGFGADSVLSIGRAWHRRRVPASSEI